MRIESTVVSGAEKRTVFREQMVQASVDEIGNVFKNARAALTNKHTQQWLAENFGLWMF
jgi:hypothetical protein